MMLIRILGYVLLLAGVVALGAEILRSLEAGYWQSLPLGEVWYGLDRGSLNGIQVLLERYLWDYLWDPVLLTVLLLPAWAVLGVPGLLILAFARRQRRKRMFS